MENPIRMDDLGVPLFSETAIYIYTYIIYIYILHSQHMFQSHCQVHLLLILQGSGCSNSSTLIAFTSPGTPKQCRRLICGHCNGDIYVIYLADSSSSSGVDIHLFHGQNHICKDPCSPNQMMSKGCYNHRIAA